MSAVGVSSLGVDYLLLAGCDAPIPPGAEELVDDAFGMLLKRNIVADLRAKNAAALRTWEWTCMRCSSRISDADCGVRIDPLTGRGVAGCGARHVYELGKVRWLAVDSFPVGYVRLSSNQRTQ